MEDQFDNLRWIENIQREDLRPIEIILIVVFIIAIHVPALLEVLNNRENVLCRDGTRSHARGRQGACSWHGGVA